MIFFISCALGVVANALLVGRTLVTMEVLVLPLFDFEEDDCLPLVNVCFTFFFGGIVILLSQLLSSSRCFVAAAITAMLNGDKQRASQKEKGEKKRRRKR